MNPLKQQSSVLMVLMMLKMPGTHIKLFLVPKLNIIASSLR